MRLPRELGPIHFVGIGGIGMSGIAEVLVNLGYQVSGSDLKDSPTTQRLASLGVRVHIGHDAKCIENAQEGARRAATLTARLLAFSRQQPLEPQPLDPNKLVGGMSEPCT